MIENIKVKLKSNIIEFFLFFSTLFLYFLELFVSNLRYSNDDQFILYRYIENIAVGNGFVYNIGERILGSTTPLFTLVMALFKYIFIGIKTPDITAFVNIIFISIAIVFFYKTANLFLRRNVSILASILFILNMSKIVAEGMESSLFILLSFSLIYYLLNYKYKISAVLLGLLLLTRPDALIIALLTCIFWFKKEGLKNSIKLFCITSITILPWLIFATIYFGSFIPQSMIAKMHTGDIVNQSSIQALKVQLAHISRLYWGKIFDPNNLILQIIFNLFPVLIFIYLSIAKKVRDFWFIVLIPILYFIAFSFSNPVMFPWYLSQIEPFYILASFIGIQIFLDKLKNNYLKIFFIILLIAGPVYFYTNSLYSENRGSKLALFEMGEYIRLNKKQSDTVGVNNIGIIGFVSGAHIIDFFGLVNNDSANFYPVLSDCRDKDSQFVIPESLIIYSKPDWLIISGDNELVPCFRNSRWFEVNYLESKKISSGTIFKLINK